VQVGDPHDTTLALRTASGPRVRGAFAVCRWPPLAAEAGICPAGGRARVAGRCEEGGVRGGTMGSPASVSVGRTGHVLEAAVDGERHDDRLGPEPFRETQRADDVRPRRDAREDALLPGEPESRRERLVVLDRPDLVDV